MSVTSRMLAASILSVVLAASGCDTNRITDTPSGQQLPTFGEVPALVVVAPDSATIAVGDVLQMRAKVYDASGNEIAGRDLTWRGSNRARVKVTGDGVLEGLTEGEDTVSVSASGASGSAVLRVRPPRVAGLTVSLSPAVIQVGESATATAVALRADGQQIGSRVFWTSSNVAVARVDDKGHITARLPGTTVITGISEGKVDSKTLTVSAGAVIPTAVSVRVTAATSLLYIGRQTKLSATVLDARGDAIANAPISWSSSSPVIASVSPTGDVTGLESGAVTVMAVSGSLMGETALAVAPVPVNAVQILLNPGSVTLGAAAHAVVFSFDAEGNALTDRVVVLTSSDTSVAKVSAAGEISTHSVGSAQITAGVDGRTASATLYVIAAPVAPVASVTVALAQGERTVGQSTQATAVLRDGQGAVLTGRAVAWSSSNTSVATVNSAGLVSAVGAGNASIVAGSEGKSASAPLTVSVASVPVVSVATVSVTINPASVEVGGGAQALGIARDASGTALLGRSIAWSSSNPSVATVGANGQIAAMSAGTVTITGTSEGKSGSGQLVVAAPAPPPAPTPSMASIDVSPAVVTLQKGESRAFSAIGQLAAGGTTPVTVTWSASGGTVSQLGGYTAGQSAGRFYVVADCSCGLRDSAEVNVVEPYTIAAINITPTTVSLAAGSSYKFTGYAWLSGGETPIWTPMVWSATGGSVDPAGNYVAGNTAGTYVVRVRSALINWRVDSAIVTITSSSSPPPPQPQPAPVATVAVTLANSSRTVGQTTQATATLRDAQNIVLTGRSIAWSSTNGAVATVNSSGVVTAVGAGTASIRATSEGQNGSAAISVTAAAPPPAPAPVASVSVSLSPATVSVGQASQVTAVVRDAQGNILTGRQLAYSISLPLLASVSSTGLVATAVAGVASVSATSEGVVGTAQLEILAITAGGGGPGSAMPNLPPGLTVFADINGDEADGFISLPNANMDIWDRVTKQQDATAPKSPSTVRRFTIRAGSGQGGTGKVEVHLLNTWNGGLGVQEIYMARWLKPSANLIGDPAGSKSLYLSTNNGTVYFNYQTTPEGVLIRPALSAIGGPYNDVWLTRNRASTPLVRGQWGLWEFYAKMNTPGQADGILRVWANGVLQLEYTDIPYRTVSTDRWRYALSDFYQNTLQPFEMWWDMDHYFVAGR